MIKMWIKHFLFVSFIVNVKSYSNHLFTLSKPSEDKLSVGICKYKKHLPDHKKLNQENMITVDPAEVIKNLTAKEDPMIKFQNYLNNYLFEDSNENDVEGSRSVIGSLLHYPVGNLMRAELYDNKSSVHLPTAELLHQGYCKLHVTKDHMQTAVDAFAIFLEGNLHDIYRLPSDYVLRSARTIAMLKVGREKLAATWKVIKGNKETHEITHQTLEIYRPLFKYVSGIEMSKLNLSDDRILTYVGTHADLDRHQVGLIASKYMQLNKHWSEPKYLNLMNNLLCGVPMIFMRTIPVNIYLQLTQQVFYHIRACDPLQRRFYLAVMTKTQVLGKSYSWSARDVSRLGLLLAEVEGSELSLINPEAMAGVTAQVMLTMSAENLQHLNKMQINYLGNRPLNIYKKKLQLYREQLRLNSRSCYLKPVMLLFLTSYLCLIM